MDASSKWSSQVATEFLKNSFAENSALYPLSVSQKTALEESDRRKAINLHFGLSLASDKPENDGSFVMQLQMKFIQLLMIPQMYGTR